MRHRLIASLALMILTAPILAAPMVAASAGSRSGCAMCVRQCACRPPGRGGGCRMEAVCGTAARQDAAAVPGLAKGILAEAVSGVEALQPSRSLCATIDLRPVSHHFVPPTPPPRLLAPACC